MSDIPLELSEAVQVWARNNRGGDCHTEVYRNQSGIVVIELSLKANDPRLEPWQNGRLRLKPVDTVMLMYQPTYTDANGRQQKAPYFEPMNITDLGISGVLEILGRGNMASGRGDFKDVMDAVQKVGERNDKLRESIRSEVRENAKYRIRDVLQDARPRVAVATDIQT